MAKERRKNITKIGQATPASFKFGVIISAAILWTNFFEQMLDVLVGRYIADLSPIVSSFVIAVLFTALAIGFIASYRKIINLLKKIKV